MCENNCKGSRSLNLNKEPTHQEVTDRINALANALNAINETPRTNMSGRSEHNKFLNDTSANIAKELSKLTSQD